MLRTGLKTTLAAMVLISIFTAASWAKVPNPADEAAINKLVAGFTECFNHKDAKACAALFTEDSAFTNIRGEVDKGRPAEEKHFQTVYSTFLKNAQRKDKVRSITFLTPRIALVDTEMEITVPPAVGASAPTVRKGLLSWVVVKQNGAWHIRIFHELDYPK